MKTKKEALEIAIKTLKSKDISYVSIATVEQIRYQSEDELIDPIPYGKYEGKKIDVFSVFYTEMWGFDERTMEVDIHAHTGEPLYIITPHSFIDV